MGNKYLVYQTEHYYDGHGEEADGESDYFIASEEDGYQDTDPNLRYDAGLEEQTELYEQDGYHTTAYSFEVKLLPNELSVELAKHYFSILEFARQRLSNL